MVSNYSEEYQAIQTKEFPALQQKAMEHFNRLGFPSTKNEEWKYTNIAPIVNKTFQASKTLLQITKDEVLKRFPFLNNSFFAVIENGRMNLAASELSHLPSDIEIINLREAKNISAVQKHFGIYADVHSDSFAALNTAFFTEGIFIHIHANAIIEKPIFVINISYANEEAVISHNRMLVIAEKNSSSKISWIAVSKNGKTETFVNAVNEIVLEENAEVEFNILQNENNRAFQICNSYVYQLKDSRFNINTITTGGSIVRNKLHIKLETENCTTHLNGLYIADDSQLIDNHTAVFHSKPNCNSNQLYKGIIGGKAHGVFNGKIFVAKDAQKTNAFQSNKNILISNDAVINAKPQLEIYADDVKCSHGATTGQLDDDALFYLRARGIGETDAKALLNFAFAGEIIHKIKIESLKNYLLKLLPERLNSNIEFDLN